MKFIKLFFTVITVCGSIVGYGQDDTTINTSDKCIKISRTSTNWQELIAFPVSSFTIPANTTKYLHMMVLYPAQPDIAIRIDGEDENSDGDPTAAIRPINSYTAIGEWETLVFPLIAGDQDIQVNALLIFPDAGFENTPARQVLNNTDAFGYIDEIVLKDNFTLSVENPEDAAVNHTLVVYPNPIKNTITIKGIEGIAKASLFTYSGKEIVKDLTVRDATTYDMSFLSPGIYMMKIYDSKGIVLHKEKLVKL